MILDYNMLFYIILYIDFFRAYERYFRNIRQSAEEG